MGHEIRILSRSTNLSEGDGVYRWDPDQGYFDANALTGVSVLINLAGASIADRRWTDRRKALLWKSRIEYTRFLKQQLEKQNTRISCYIGASASGFYGDRADELLTEKSESGTSDFLVDLSNAWEDAHWEFERFADRVSIVRLGVVLAVDGGAFPKLRKSVLLGFGGYLGNGNQYFPWIHIEDLAMIFIQIISDQNIQGIINGSAPHPVTNYEFTKALASLKWGMGLLIPVPAFVLRLLLGEMANALLFSQRMIPEKLIQLSFTFQYPDLKSAMKDLLGN
ncbi:MAG: TIGR01777 family oxidoreductase, partial [Saprospiraceae bacterium]|nr:TIGR01777 family oxidoreductase [Saprospiraceae bacterium]